MTRVDTANEVVAMVATSNVAAMQYGARGARLLVYGDTVEEARENIGRVRDALKALGARGQLLKNSRGYALEGVPFRNDPFGQVKHWVATIRVLSCGQIPDAKGHRS